MATVLEQITGTAGVGAQVLRITGQTRDAAAAAGYAAWVESITGTYPLVREHEGRAVVILSDEQAALMRAWLDRQLLSTVLPGRKTEKSLDIQFGPVAGPVALKYLVLVGAAFFAFGFLSRGVFR